MRAESVDSAVFTIWTAREGGVAEWDFCADVDAVVSLSLEGRGPLSMSETVQAAASTITRLEEQAPQALTGWLHANATVLLAQQLLVASVQSQRQVEDRLHAALTDWRQTVMDPAVPTDTGGVSEAPEWLRENRPGLLRAWLLSRLPALLRSELDDL